MCDQTGLTGYVGQAQTFAAERDALLEIIRPLSKFLEVGTYDGATCRYLAERRPRAKFLCVDPFRQVTIANWLANHTGNMHLYVGTVWDLIGILPVPPLFDAMFVDGDHDYWYCRGDLECSLRLLIPGGVLAVHDYHVDEYQGVTRAVDEFCEGRGFTVSRVVETLAFLDRSEGRTETDE